jgi:hypothetical protein
MLDTAIELAFIYKTTPMNFLSLPRAVLNRLYNRTTAYMDANNNTKEE